MDHRDDIPLPSPTDTILEVLALGKPKAITEIHALSEQMGRGHTLNALKQARARLVTLNMIIPAAGHSLIPTNNILATQRRYMLA